jgi:hypothetical protein
MPRAELGVGISATIMVGTGRVGIFEVIDSDAPERMRYRVQVTSTGAAGLMTLIWLQSAAVGTDSMGLKLASRSQGLHVLGRSGEDRWAEDTEPPAMVLWLLCYQPDFVEIARSIRFIYPDLITFDNVDRLTGSLAVAGYSAAIVTEAVKTASRRAVNDQGVQMSVQHEVLEPAEKARALALQSNIPDLMISTPLLMALSMAKAQCTSMLSTKIIQTAMPRLDCVSLAQALHAAYPDPDVVEHLEQLSSANKTPAEIALALYARWSTLTPVQITALLARKTVMAPEILDQVLSAIGTPDPVKRAIARSIFPPRN